MVLAVTLFKNAPIYVFFFFAANINLIKKDMF